MVVCFKHVDITDSVRKRLKISVKTPVPVCKAVIKAKVGLKNLTYKIYFDLCNTFLVTT